MLLALIIRKERQRAMGVPATSAVEAIMTGAQYRHGSSVVKGPTPALSYIFTHAPYSAT